MFTGGVFSTFQPGYYTDYGSERVNVFFFSVLPFCMQATILKRMSGAGLRLA